MNLRVVLILEEIIQLAELKKFIILIATRSRVLVKSAGIEHLVKPSVEKVEISVKAHLAKAEVDAAQTNQQH